MPTLIVFVFISVGILIGLVMIYKRETVVWERQRFNYGGTYYTASIEQKRAYLYLKLRGEGVFDPRPNVVMVVGEDVMRDRSGKSCSITFDEEQGLVIFALQHERYIYDISAEHFVRSD